MGWFKIIVKREKDWNHSHPLTISLSKESFYKHFKYIGDDIDPFGLFIIIKSFTKSLINIKLFRSLYFIIIFSIQMLPCS